MGRVLALLLLALGAAGCATPGAVAFRHPDFRPAEIRRPAVLLQVSLEAAGLLGGSELSPRERDSLPPTFEIAVIERLNVEGVLPADVTLVVQDAVGGPGAAFERLDRRQALERAHAVGADVVLILDAHLSRRDLPYCREGRRPFAARTTFWTLGTEIIRVSDGTRLLAEPPGPSLRVGDVEADCDQGRISRRLSTDELVGAAVERALSPLLRR